MNNNVAQTIAFINDNCETNEKTISFYRECDDETHRVIVSFENDDDYNSFYEYVKNNANDANVNDNEFSIFVCEYINAIVFFDDDYDVSFYV